jgi:hypothetical protein
LSEVLHRCLVSSFLFQKCLDQSLCWEFFKSVLKFKDWSTMSLFKIFVVDFLKSYCFSEHIFSLLRSNPEGVVKITNC